MFEEKGSTEETNPVKESPATSTFTAPQTTTTESQLKRRKTAKVTSQDLESIPTSTAGPETSAKTKFPLRKRKPAKSQDLESTSTSTARPKTTTRLPEFVHMPTVKFDFGYSSFHSKGGKRRTDTRADLYKDRINESQKERDEESTWSSRNDIEKENVKPDNILLRNKENDQFGNRIGSIPALNSNIPVSSSKVGNKIESSNVAQYSSKARFNDKDDSMFTQAASNR